ncbi:asparaginase [Bartonella sp. W8098]|uniref:asparaginase n=1 Tax=Bartonella TaxID=773 RepID=UPI0018DBEA31|nr:MULTISPECIES: asparaginase [Bartonella]MBH9986922.1 asparaginase [Bartonella apis]MBI0171028.1 asparaginase [Bartonella sp. W8151]
MPTVAIGALGGTIAMVAGTSGGVEPELSADQLAKSVPGISELSTIHSKTLAKLPSGSLSFRVLFDALDWANNQIDEGAKAVILTQGTDTLEESAFLLSLYWQKPQPLIITGAMRAPMAAGADGPANLLSSLLVAIDEQSIGRGVMVVMNDEIHSPYFVRKSQSLKVETFKSGLIGPLGAVVEAKPVFFRSTDRLPKPLSQPKTLDKKVALVEACLSSGSDHLELVFSSGIYQGVVIAGFGSGHVSFEEADIIKNYAHKLPVIMATRAYSGPTSEKTYGYKGSEIDLMRGGVLMGGWLSPLKARLLLWALLSARHDKEEIEKEWKHWQIG